MKNNDKHSKEDVAKKSVTKEELDPYIKLLEPHKEFITSAREWNAYRKEKELPHSQTLIGKFGSWNAVKEALGITEVNARHRPIKYDKATIERILKEHGRHLTSKLAWDKYAHKKELPNYTVLFERLSDKEIADLTGYRRVYTKDIINQIVKKYYPTTPPTFREWNYLAKNEKDVPSASLIVVRYGSWKSMIEDIYK